jgi:hypothetical protein
LFRQSVRIWRIDRPKIRFSNPAAAGGPGGQESLRVATGLGFSFFGFLTSFL